MCRFNASVTGCKSHPWTCNTLLARIETFMSQFLAPYFLVEERSSNAMLQQIVAVFLQQDLLLGCKPLVDLLKVAVV